MAEQEITINERTTVSLFSAGQIAWALGAVVFFVAVLYAKANATAERVDRHADAIKEMRTNLVDIKTSLAKLEGLLEGAKRK